MPMISYVCPCCGAGDEHYYHRQSDAPEFLSCRSVDFLTPEKKTIEQKIVNPDGTETVELVEVELEPEMTACTGIMTQRESWLDSTTARPARGFEPLVVYQSATDPTKFSIPGRNYEKTDPGYKRIEITNMHEYNKLVKQVNNIERSKMSDHREMHKTYWDARRRAMRDNVNARVGSSGMSRIVDLLRTIRKRSDTKTNKRYGKPLEPNFHAQLLEFNQGKIQDYCDADTGWKATRAK